MHINPRHALVILSGDQDSATSLILVKQQFEEVHCLVFGPGYAEAYDLAMLVGVKSCELIELPTFLRAGIDMPEAALVPMGNVIALAIAANWAQALGCGAIVCAFNRDDAGHPECSPAFRSRMEDLVNEALGLNFADDSSRMLIFAPLLATTKAQAIGMLVYLDAGADVLLAFTMTEESEARRRAQAFREAGRPDPLILRTYMEGRLPALPDTENYSDADLNKDLIARISNIARGLASMKGELPDLGPFEGQRA